MRATERDTVICLLAVTAGSADGWAFFGLGGAFVANMTGNTVLLGMSVFKIHGDMLHPLISLASYIAGVICGSLLTRNAKPVPEGRWPKQVWSALLLEGVMLSCAAVAWFAVHPTLGVPPYHTVLLGWVAFAIGVQSASMLQLKIPGVVTTYITGTWTTLMNSLARFQAQPPAERQQFESRLGMQAAVLGSYFLSAVVTGCLFRYVPAAVGIMPPLCVLLVAIYGLRTES